MAEKTVKKQGQERKRSISEIVMLTDKSDPKPEHLTLLRERLDDDDTLVKLNEVSERTIKCVLSTYCDSALVKELYTRQISEKRNELGYSSADLMVRMLIDQVVICHLRVNMIEGLHAEKVRQSHSTETGYYWDRLLTSYQRRFHRACQSLARVRKLLAEANLTDQRVQNARSASTKNSASILRMMTTKCRSTGGV